jgi:hypothetical protein
VGAATSGHSIRPDHGANETPGAKSIFAGIDASAADHSTSGNQKQFWRDPERGPGALRKRYDALQGMGL